MCTQVIRREIMSTPWAITPKDPKFKDTPPPQIQREIDYVTYFMNNCNENKESIETLIAMAVQDLLELDAGVFVKGFSGNSYATTPAGGLELQPMGNRDLVEIWARDGGSMLAETDVNGVKYRWWQYSYLHPAIAPLEFDINEVAYFMQYPRSYSVYGWSPLQSMDNILSSLINSAAWNSTFFAEATLPSGMIGVPNMNPEELERFRQYFRTEIKGKWHRISVVNSDVKYVPFALTNRDMQWLDGQQWYSKLVMALFNITPTELGFTDDIRATGKAMGAQDEVQKRKSTLPVLQLLEQVINNHIVSELSQVVMFQFKPVDRTEELMQIDVDNKDLTLGKVTPNDIRKKRGLGDSYWWGDEPLDIITARIARGEPIPPLQLPKVNEPTSPQQSPMLQRNFGAAVRKSFDRRTEFDDDTFLQAFKLTDTAKAWPPTMNPLTGLPHTQDDSVPKEQYDMANENAKFQKNLAKEISGNRVGWGKEQREDYLGQQDETIPGANQRGQLPTAIGRKPGEYDQRDGMINPSDAGRGYPTKGIQSIPGAMGTRGDNHIGAGNNGARFGPGGTVKPYDDTIDIRRDRNRPVEDSTENRVVPGDPVMSYGQHPWAETGTHGDGLVHGHRTGVDQSQNPAYLQVQPSEAKKPQFPTSRTQEMFDKERKEHPDFTDEQVWQIVKDHMNKKDWEVALETHDLNERGDTIDADTISSVKIPGKYPYKKDIRYDKNPGMPTQPTFQDSPEHDDAHHDPLTKIDPNNPSEHAGDRGGLDEYQLDRLRQSPAGPAATLPKGYMPDSGTGWRMSESGVRGCVEGNAEDDVDGTRKAKEPGGMGFLREPISEPDLSEHLPSYYGDQQSRNQYMKDEEDLLPHPELPKPESMKGLDLSGTLQDQIERFGKMTDETKKEFGALLIRRDGQILLDQVQVGEDHAVNIEPTRPLAENEEILGTYHQHPASNQFSVWDMLSFLHSKWEQASILNAADGSIIVAVKSADTKPLNADPEQAREQFKDYSNEQFAKEFGFLLYRGSVDDLQAAL